MTDTVVEKSRIRLAREAEELSRERVARLLDPPISAKTLERWERGANVPVWRIKQLAAIYRVKSADLREAA